MLALATGAAVVEEGLSPSSHVVLEVLRRRQPPLTTTTTRTLEAAATAWAGFLHPLNIHPRYKRHHHQPRSHRLEPLQIARQLQLVSHARQQQQLWQWEEQPQLLIDCAGPWTRWSLRRLRARLGGVVLVQQLLSVAARTSSKGHPPVDSELARMGRAVTAGQQCFCCCSSRPWRPLRRWAYYSIHSLRLSLSLRGITNS